MTVRRTDGNGMAKLPGAGCQIPDRGAQTPPRMPPLTQRLLGAEEAGRYLGFKSAWPIRGLAWKGMLPVVRIGKRRIMFDVQDLDQFIQERKTREVPGAF